MESAGTRSMDYICPMNELVRLNIISNRKRESLFDRVHIYILKLNGGVLISKVWNFVGFFFLGESKTFGSRRRGWGHWESMMKWGCRLRNVVIAFKHASALSPLCCMIMAICSYLRPSSPFSIFYFKKITNLSHLENMSENESSYTGCHMLPPDQALTFDRLIFYTFYNKWTIFLNTKISYFLKGKICLRRVFRMSLCGRT